MDDDDEFLYGGSVEPVPKQKTSVPQPISLEQSQVANGVIEHLENEAENAETPPSVQNGEADTQEEEQEESEDEDDDDIEFIMEQPTRSLDFRQTPGRPPTARVPSTSTPSQPKAVAPTLTTEYTPIQRGSQTQPPLQPQPLQNAPSGPSLPAQFHQTPQYHTQETQDSIHKDDGADSSSLPPVIAPPSHPAIDPTATGIYDSRSILEVDMNAMTDKPWRRPGSDISDWFNYGFDEISWEAYCYRRRDLGELANVLKTNVINFAAMPEDQLNALPPEVRTMVMTGATAMMNGAAANPGMMAPGVLMDISTMMNAMGMGMGMNGDMGMGGQMMPVDGQVQQSGVGMGMSNGTPEQVGAAVGMMQDGFNGGPAGAGMMNMGMGGDFGMQDQNQMAQNQMAQSQIAQNQMAQNQMAQNQMAQQMYPIEVPASVTPVPGGGRGGGPPAPFRGRGSQAGMSRGRGFPGRGRGRGAYIPDGVPPPVSVRPASPLPPGVPTGPRNQNKYKDRDGNAPAVDGLDYGGGGGGGGKELKRTPSGEPEDRSAGRKRRSSPGPDDGRGMKRR